MIDKWLALIEGVKLSRSESTVVKKFKQDPDGKYFLQFSDILKTHGKENESLELLIEGVNRHPTFSVARVLLAKNLLDRGLVEEAWQTLEESPVSLEGNKLSTKLKIKICVLLGYEDIARSLLFEGKTGTDSQILSIKQDIINLGFDSARIKLIEELSLDKDFILKNFSSSKIKKKKNQKSNPSKQSDSDSKDNLDGIGSIDDIDNIDNIDNIDIKALTTKRSSTCGSSSLNDFHLSNLSNALSESQESIISQNFASSSLSSMTLASIYTKQGHYGKALGIYRQLLLEKPHNKVLLEKIAELSELDKKQTISDIAVDPELVDKMEQLKIIDYKISILNSLMSKLDQ